MRTSPERYATRAAAVRALWKMAGDGRTDATQDRRYRALVLLATFASLRWGEVAALTRADLDVKARTVRIRAANIERSTGPLVLGPPKSRASRRIVGIPAAIIPDLERHLAVYVKNEPGALIFAGIMGGPLRRSGFNRLSGWPHVVEALGMPGLHFHDYADVCVMPIRAGESLAVGLPARFMSATKTPTSGLFRRSNGSAARSGR